MKCPYREIIKEYKAEDGTKEVAQEFAECYGTQCAAAYIVEYNGVPKIEGCKRLMKSKEE